MATVRDEQDSELTSGSLLTGVGLAEVLPSLVGLDRTGRVSAAQDEAPALEVWIARGRVVDAGWDRLRALSALEMGAVFLPRASFVFSAGLQSQTRTFDLSPTDLAARLAEVAREGAAVTGSIPGPRAVPTRVEPPRQRPPREPEAVRLLDAIDGRRSVAELVEGRQPLMVLRGLASLVEQGAISFQAVPSSPAAVPDNPTPDATPPSHGGLAALRGRPVSLVIVGVTLLVLAFAIVDSLQTLTPEAPLPAAVRPVATTAPTLAAAPAAAPTVAPQPTVAPTVAPQPTAAPTLAPAPVAAPNVAPQPTVAPTVASQPTAAPTLAPAPAEAPTVAPQPTVAPTVAAQASVATSRTLLDEGFSTGAPGWPNAATTSAWWDSLGYHLEPRLAGQHVAIVAPGNPPLADIEVTGLFHKSGGPNGGGYGLILRAQGPLDGNNQGGRYYVFEVGDRGEVGAWRRDDDRWLDLVPWTKSAAVFAGGASNRLDVRATGSQFTFSVNDNPVAQVTDDTLAAGAVGVFAGGDGNQVQVERFTVTGL
jgi:hypothetical protein